MRLSIASGIFQLVHHHQNWSEGGQRRDSRRTMRRRAARIATLAAIAVAAPALPPHLPDVWGGNASAPPGGVLGGCSGWLFGVSGLDGGTDHLFAAVVEGTADDFDLRFCALEVAVTVRFRARNVTKVACATGDAIVLETGGERVGASRAYAASARARLAFASHDVLVGAGFEVSLRGAALLDGCSSKATVAVCAANGTVAVARATDGDAAVAAARAALSSDVDAVVAARLAQYANETAVPRVVTGREKLRNKALSIMRVDALAPEGNISEHWSTPDRSPHRNMWLWDSCFHAIGMAQVPRIATLPGEPAGADVARQPSGTSRARRGERRGRDVDRSMRYDAGVGISRSRPRRRRAGRRHRDRARPDLERQRRRDAAAVCVVANHCGPARLMNATRSLVPHRPPLLAWAVWEVVGAARDACANRGDARAVRGSCERPADDRLAWALPRLEAYISWDRSNRGDGNRTSLLSWTKGTESGMDNSQRFDAGTPGLLAVDFSTFAARECGFISRIATAVGNASAAAAWADAAAEISGDVHARLWDAEREAYLDRAPDGPFSNVESVASFLPLLLDDFPADRRDAMLRALGDNDRFNTTLPLPSVARSTADFSTDMWRGPMWINYNWLVALGLRARGAAGAADALSRITLDAVSRWSRRRRNPRRPRSAATEYPRRGRGAAARISTP